MVQRLLLNKDDTYTEYNRENFETHLKKHFKLEGKIALVGGKRHIYHASPKQSA
jgi:hypothetical protein